MPNQRHFHRIDFVNKADFIVNSTVSEAFLADISLKGAMIEFPQLCTAPLGSRCQLTVKLNDSEVQLDFEGEVVHVHGAMAGIRFIRVDIDTMIHLRRLLELNYGDSEEIRRELPELIDSTGRK
jgi:hypothetical protein